MDAQNLITIGNIYRKENLELNANRALVLQIQVCVWVTNEIKKVIATFAAWKNRLFLVHASAIHVHTQLQTLVYYHDLRSIYCRKSRCRFADFPFGDGGTLDGNCFGKYLVKSEDFWSV